MTDALLNYWLPHIAQYPENFYWYTNGDILLLAENRVIGGIGLTGPPFETGETMVGYAISKPYQNSGFAAEALQCLLSWAFQNLQLQAIVATTPTNNIASHRGLQKNNFVNLGLQDEYIHWRQERD